MKRDEAAALTGRKHVISFRVRGCSSGGQSGSKQTQEERKAAKILQQYTCQVTVHTSSIPVEAVGYRWAARADVSC